MVKQQKTTAMLQNRLTETVMKFLSQTRQITVFQNTQDTRASIMIPQTYFRRLKGRRATKAVSSIRAASTRLRQDWMTRNLSSMLILRVSKNWQSWQGSNVHSQGLQRNDKGRRQMQKKSKRMQAEEKSSHRYTGQGINIGDIYYYQITKQTMTCFKRN